MAEAIISPDRSRNDLLKVAGAGVLSGILTPLMVPLIDRIAGTPGDFRIALVAIPFAVLVFILIRRGRPTTRPRRRETSCPGWPAALLAPA